jgi:hypothetical protein
MPTTFFRASLFAVLAFGAGCGPAPSKALTYYQNIKPIIDGRCAGCHQTDGIAPFSLTTYAQVSAMAGSVKEAVVSRRMPPYLAGPDCNEYIDNQRLTDDEVERIVSWSESGALEGVANKSQQAVETGSKGLSRVDVKVSMPEPYKPTQGPDDYRCFVVDWKETQDTFVVGMNVVPGNPKVVHHVIAYLIGPDHAAAYAQLDADTPGVGYTCFGGPGGPSRGGWLGAWAPGGRGTMYPPDTGIVVHPGSKVVLQVHYNAQLSPDDAGDLTSLELALAPTVRKRAAIIPWTNPEWMKEGGMPIPAYESLVSHSFSFDPTGVLGWVSGGALPGGNAFRVWSGATHQHLLGKSSRLEIERADGTNECLLDIPRWDFHWQRAYGFSRSKVMRPGDKLKVTCRWDNSAENQPIINGQKQLPRAVEWGEGTNDEMCLGILYVSE